MAADAVKDTLNRRYESGAHGVLLHILDGAVHTERPWVPTKRGYLSASLYRLTKYRSFSRPRHMWLGTYTGGPALVVSNRSAVVCSYPQDAGSMSWPSWKAASGLAGCGPRLCTPDDVDAPHARSYYNTDPGRGACVTNAAGVHGYPCAFPSDMYATMISVFDHCSSAYNEVVVQTRPDTWAIEALVGFPVRTHLRMLKHFGLNERQLPLLHFGSGIKGPPPLFR